MSDTFFYLSKIVWFLLSPDHFLVVLFLLSVGYLLAGWRKLAGWLGLPALAMLACLCVFPLGNFALAPLERWAQTHSVLPEAVDKLDGIIVLGGSEEAALSAQYNQPLFGGSAERIMAIPALRHTFPDTPILFTGGSGVVRTQDYKEADVVQHWLASIGISEQVFYESRSRNTFENALFAEDVFDKKKGNYLLVTSAFHMPRAMAVFQGQGWKIHAYAVDYHVDKIAPARSLWMNLRDLGYATHEWLGLIVYKLTGRTQQLFPSDV